MPWCSHNSTFSDYSSISRIISFHVSVFCTYGAFSHPNSRTIWGSYHPIYLLLSTGHLPSRTFSMGHPFIPFLAAFHCTLHLPSLRGVYIHMGHLSIPFHYLLISHGAPMLPIVIFAVLIYPTFGTHGHLNFLSDCPYIVSDPSSEILVSFLFNYTEFLYFHQIMSF